MQRREFISRLGVAAVGALYGSGVSFAQSTGSVAHRTIGANGIHLHLVEQGEGPLIVLCHGFPESWYSWRHQLPALAAAGFRAVAVDVRGYGRSTKPAEISAYRMLAHVADNTGVVRALDAPVAAIIGHDWGSPIAAA